MRAMPSRRAVLAGAGSVGLGVGVASQIDLGPISTSAPADDTWPLRRYGPANTGRNPNATIPSDPGIDWEQGAVTGSLATELVVGPDQVYVTGDGVAALNRADGTVAWDESGGGRAAFSDGTLYIATTDIGTRQDPELRAFDGSSGSELWTDTSVNEVTSLLPAGGTLFVGSEQGLEAFDASSGRKRWSTSLPPEPIPVTHDGSLYTAGGLTAKSGSINRYDQRSVLDVPLGRAPPTAWSIEYGGRPRSLISTDRSLITGVRHEIYDGDPGVAKIDPATGEVLWQAIEPTSGEESFGVEELAVAGDRCIAGIIQDGHRIVSVGTADGNIGWQRPTKTAVTALAISEDAVVAGTANGRIRALDLTTGADRWQVDIPNSVDAVVPVGETVFAVTEGGHVYALRNDG